MRICVPTATAEGAKAVAYGHFGSAPHFTILDTVTGLYEIVDNADQHHAHGMCHPMSLLEGQKIDAVVCAGIGARALQRLNDGGVRVYRTIPATVEEIAVKIGSGELEEMTLESSCAGHGCH
ncbi:MAG TPA: NifB/NifX family molybdenum-iron cluster-binding protein [Candidatus Aminicenantes bacterium]|nr:NifB/NifX family molybdenum-iron cluster-binding protein [Candidatus Aminicenantes bacterium]HRY63773.1 NifB/NifX family molybdenum-iron cluster-binding protein [Candidatus Aminicenantes bacterium]HRZ70686.1 NifB/NifX family molybdenum-iron cluster-binding protein [Candidatus Aminicenantes bacterium]